MCGEKLGVGAARIGCGGITPAYAGKRTKPAWNWLRARDHPRVCGEKFAFFVAKTLKMGSPPRMRGKVKPVLWAARVAGITPAYAGKRQGRAQFWWPAWDHPRMCGEKALKSWLMSGDVGSPPRVRGKVFGQVLAALVLGITPAYAGKSRPEACGVAFLRDHPRVCGEKRRPSSHSHTLPGSPPRVRGKVPSSI